MRLRVRRLLLLAAVVPTLLPAVASAAGCVTVVCLPVHGLLQHGTYAIEGAVPSGGGGDGSGVLCEYVRIDDTVSDPNGGDLVWTETQKWGDEHPDEWDTRVCAPLCVVLGNLVTTVPVCD